MKIILIKDVPGVGRKGELKEASEGYAKNFLIAKGFAQIATPEIQAKIAKEAKEAEGKKQKELGKMQNLKSELEKRTFTIKMKVGDKGQVFSGVHEKDIIDAVNGKLNTELDKHAVNLKKPIKDLGLHEVELKLASGISAKIKINIEAQ